MRFPISKPQKHTANMGVVAASGADTPRYRPEMPSVTNVFRSIPNTDALPTPPVCIRTLTRSNGWPTSTAHTPPTPPDRKLLRADSAILVLVLVLYYIVFCIRGKKAQVL